MVPEGNVELLIASVTDFSTGCGTFCVIVNVLLIPPMETVTVRVTGSEPLMLSGKVTFTVDVDPSRVAEVTLFEVIVQSAVLLVVTLKEAVVSEALTGIVQPPSAVASPESAESVKVNSCLIVKYSAVVGSFPSIAVTVCVTGLLVLLLGKVTVTFLFPDPEAGLTLTLSGSSVVRVQVSLELLRTVNEAVVAFGVTVTPALDKANTGAEPRTVNSQEARSKRPSLSLT